MDNLRGLSQNSAEYKFRVSPSEYLPLRDVVFRNIRDAILAGSLTPGERLMEKQLAELIGVSRTPVREALRKLELEGFVEMSPRKGAMVSIISEKGIKDVLEIRASLEALAAKLACRNKTPGLINGLKNAKAEFAELALDGNLEKLAERDMAFHGIIFDASANDRLVLIINNLREQIHRYRMEYLKDKIYIKQIIDEHDEIFEAIEQGDALKAATAASQHIYNQEEAIIKSIK